MSDEKRRHYCVICGAKKYAKYLFLIRVHLLSKNVWLCSVCYCFYKTDNEIIKPAVSTEEDIVKIKNQINENI